MYVFQVAVGSDVGVNSGRVDVVVVLGVGRKRAARTPNRMPKRIKASQTSSVLPKDELDLICGLVGAGIAEEVGKGVVDENGGRGFA